LPTGNTFIRVDEDDLSEKLQFVRGKFFSSSQMTGDVQSFPFVSKLRVEQYMTTNTNVAIKAREYSSFAFIPVVFASLKITGTSIKFVNGCFR